MLNRSISNLRPRAWWLIGGCSHCSASSLLGEVDDAAFPAALLCRFDRPHDAQRCRRRDPEIGLPQNRIAKVLVVPAIAPGASGHPALFRSMSGDAPVIRRTNRADCERALCFGGFPAPIG